MSDHDPADPLPRWRRLTSRPDTPTLVGIGAGLALYLVVVLALGELALGVGLAVVILLAASLARSLRAIRQSRRERDDATRQLREEDRR